MGDLCPELQFLLSFYIFDLDEVSTQQLKGLRLKVGKQVELSFRSLEALPHPTRPRLGYLSS